MPTLYSKIEQYLRSGIHDGTWKPGDVLPKEIELCEMFNVSRPTVRTALANLVQEGLITRTKRKGTCVKAWRTLESSTVFIESFQQELAEKGVETVTEVLEFRCAEAPEHVLKMLDLQPGENAVKVVRMRYAKDSFEKGPVVLTTSYIIGEFWPRIQRYDLEHTGLRVILKKIGIERSLMDKEITIHNLSEREARLLGENPDTPAISVNSVTWDQTNRKIEYCESIYPANRNRFLLRIRK